MSDFYGVFGEGAEILAEWEHYSNWQGDGCAIARMPDGSYAVADYSHCSCRGPEETVAVRGSDDTIDGALRFLGQVDAETLRKKLNLAD